MAVVAGKLLQALVSGNGGDLMAAVEREAVSNRRAHRAHAHDGDAHTYE